MNEEHVSFVTEVFESREKDKDLEYTTYPGGTLEHSLNVDKRLANILDSERSYKPESATTIDMASASLCALCHDVCKANMYIVETRNTKDENGQWIQAPYYAVDDQLPYGHGEKSVYILSQHIKLSEEEAMSIRWHMGGFDDSVKGGSYALSRVFEKYPLALMLHIADMQSSYLDEMRKIC